MSVLRDQFSKHVLIVDDSAISRSLLIDLVESLGATAHVARDGWHALEAARNLPLDLILMDCRMPGIDGYATTRLIRDLPAQSLCGGGHLPIIGVTATYNPSTMKRCLKAGMDGCLAKPLRRSTLAELLNCSTSGAISQEHQQVG